MKPTMFCKNNSGTRRWQHSSMKCAALSALSENRIPLLPRMPTGMPWMWAKPATSVVPYSALNSSNSEPSTSRDHLAYVVLLLQIDRHEAVELGGVVFWLDRLGEDDIVGPPRVQIGDDAAAQRQRMAVVLGIIIGDAGFLGVHVGAAQLLGTDQLAGSGLHQRRAAEKDGALVAHDDGLVRHRRHIGAARGARAHHHRDLGDAGGRQGRLVVEDAAEMLAVGKHLGPVRQVGATGIDEIDARQPVLA